MDKFICCSKLKANLKAYLDEVCNEHDPLLVKRKNGEDVIIISRADYESLAEKGYLLQSPNNAKRLIEALYRNEK